MLPCSLVKTCCCAVVIQDTPCQRTIRRLRRTGLRHRSINHNSWSRDRIIPRRRHDPRFSVAALVLRCRRDKPVVAQILRTISNAEASWSSFGVAPRSFFITCGPDLDWPSALLADYNAAFTLKSLPRCFASYDCTGQQPLDSGTGRDERRTRAALTGTVFFTLSCVCIRGEFPSSRKRGLSGDREGRVHVAAIPLA